MNLLITIAFLSSIDIIFAYNALIKISEKNKFNYSGKIRLMNEFYDEAADEYEGKLFKKHLEQLFLYSNLTVNLEDLISEKQTEDKVKYPIT